ncbi:hypothetical protein [Nostoc favosum]|uniref:Uncharacterized protein n=1 Tax=Nostoc favosum CHAB5714 TaxID=2780399 RepID=A0ABS8IK61_9NOSO|nr:hypothetical protein [Nostoc favosum]MCC5604236.1 hypothetical protein [Nostoc favosum CHAB5714]
MDTAKPSNQKLLAHAHLVKLQGDKAILEVTPAYLNKFESSKEAMPTAGYAYAKMLQRATQSQQPMTVLIKTANKSSNGRVKANTLGLRLCSVQYAWVKAETDVN